MHTITPVSNWCKRVIILWFQYNCQLVVKCISDFNGRWTETGLFFMLRRIKTNFLHLSALSNFSKRTPFTSFHNSWCFLKDFFYFIFIYLFDFPFHAWFKRDRDLFYSCKLIYLLKSESDIEKHLKRMTHFPLTVKYICKSILI